MTLSISPNTLKLLEAKSQLDEDLIAGRDVLTHHTQDGRIFRFRLVCEFIPSPDGEYITITEFDPFLFSTHTDERRATTKNG